MPVGVEVAVYQVFLHGGHWVAHAVAQRLCERNAVVPAVPVRAKPVVLRQAEREPHTCGAGGYKAELVSVVGEMPVGARFLLRPDGEQVVEVGAVRRGLPVRLGILRRHGEPGVEPVNEIRQKSVRLFNRADLEEAEDVRKPPLQGLPQPLDATLCLRRVRGDQLDPQLAARPLPLRLRPLRARELLLKGRAPADEEARGAVGVYRAGKPTARTREHLPQQLVVAQQALVLAEVQRDHLVRSVINRAVQGDFMPVHEPVVPRAVNLYQVALVRTLLARQVLPLLPHGYAGAGRHYPCGGERVAHGGVRRHLPVAQVVRAAVAERGERSSGEKRIVGGDFIIVVLFVRRDAPGVAVDEHGVAVPSVPRLEPPD